MRDKKKNKYNWELRERIWKKVEIMKKFIVYRKIKIGF